MPASSNRYGYDRLGRLTDVRDTTTASGTCAWRRCAYNDRADRTSRTTTPSGTPTCADPAAPGSAEMTTTSYTYDSADGLVSDTAPGTAGWVYDPFGRITGAPVQSNPGARVSNTFFANDLVASQTIEGVAKQAWALDPLQRFATSTSQTCTGAAWAEAVTKVNHYDSDGDSPAWVEEDASLSGEITRFVDGLDGQLAVQTGKAGARVLQLVDLHGDVMTTVPIADGAAAADWGRLQHQSADEFGNPLDPTTGTARAASGAAPGKDGRYGWLGGVQRSAQALAGVLLMGVRLYDPGTGRFWSTDPEPGGNATAYDYCSGDPVNCTDLDGRWSRKGLLKKVAVWAEVASIIPGPAGAVASAISAGAYAATGNKRKALGMAATVGLALVGGGAVAAAVKWRGPALKAGKALLAAVRGCKNSFTPETGVVMADGTTVAIEQVQVGDLVASLDPISGELSAQPVLDVIIGTGTKHLITVTTGPAFSGVLGADEPATVGEEAWTATAEHPVWVEGRGWTEAKALSVGDRMLGATGGIRVVRAMHDEGWLSGQTVYNLSIANTHTYLIGHDGADTLVHNASICQLKAPHVPRGPGVYTIHCNDGTHYVGRSFTARARVNSHFHKSGKFAGQKNDVSRIEFQRGGLNLVSLKRQEQRRIDAMRARYGRENSRNKRNELR